VKQENIFNNTLENLELSTHVISYIFNDVIRLLLILSFLWSIAQIKTFESNATKLRRIRAVAAWSRMHDHAHKKKGKRE